MTKEVFEASIISSGVDLLSDVLKVALAGILSNPTMMTRSSHDFVTNFEDSSMNLTKSYYKKTL